MRVAGMGGVVGLDLTAVLTAADLLGFDQRAMALLLPAAEAGMVEGYRKLEEDRRDEAIGPDDPT